MNTNQTFGPPPHRCPLDEQIHSVVKWEVFSIACDHPLLLTQCLRSNRTQRRRPLKRVWGVLYRISLAAGLPASADTPTLTPAFKSNPIAKATLTYCTAVRIRNHCFPTVVMASNSACCREAKAGQEPGETVPKQMLLLIVFGIPLAFIAFRQVLSKCRWSFVALYE